MAEHELYKLAAGVQLLEMDELSNFAKMRFEYEESDVVLTMPDSRITSKLINRATADFLITFKQPQSWEKAIVSFAGAANKDPQQMAEEVFGLLISMERLGYLVRVDEDEDVNSHIQQYFKTGDNFNGYTLKQKWQSLDDTEVFMAEDEYGLKYALKLLVAGDPDNRRLFETETSILERLDGSFNPKLVGKGETATHFYFITEWFEGKSCDKYADQFRNYNTKENTLKQIALCKSILVAYKHLHDLGIFHGDVNLRNILVSASGEIKIIDYALGVTETTAKSSSRPGVVFFYEPEYANAIINGKRRPPVTARGEQYAIAALLYYLLTGHYYVDFSIEKKLIFQQILSGPPLPFESFDLNLPAELNAVFGVALAKDPSARFENLEEFATAIDSTYEGVRSSVDYFTTVANAPAASFVAFVANKFSWQSSFLKNGLSLPPTCSVNYGAAGIAYMYYRMACIKEEPGLLQLAGVWASHATDFVSQKNNAFASKEALINETTVGKRSIYHSATGAWLVQSLINITNDDSYNIQQSLQQYLHYAKINCDKVDLTLGKASLLVGSSILVEQLKGHNFKELVYIRSFTGGILKEIWQEIEPHPPIHLSNELKYYGIAHGWAGLLYATLLWCIANDKPLPLNFFDRVDQLLLCVKQSDEGLYWPVSTQQPKSWNGWCNGSAGYVFLWTLLYKYTVEEKYLGIAKKCADHFYKNAYSRNANLCCGMSGKAYAMLNLYNTTFEKSWLHKAQEIEKMIMQQIGSPALHNNSLYKGEVGVAVLLAEMGQPTLSRMPLFEV